MIRIPITYRYRRNSYQVTMVTNNGDPATEKTYLYGTRVEEMPERAGYSFDGWYQVCRSYESI